MLATLVLTVAVFSVVMALFVLTPVFFRRNITTGSPFDAYFEQQCIAYVRHCWQAVIKQQDDFLQRRHQAADLATLIFLCSGVVVLAVERDPEVDFKKWFQDWLAHEGGARVQAHILLVAWQFATEKQPQLRQHTLVELLKRWQ